MVTYTPILKLAKPLFDQTPWDQDINGDLNILDSAIGNFFGIANYIGLWRNGTAYVAGQVVTDAVDSSMWTCVISHTSAAGSTFAADRLANPTYWSKEIANATDLAQQAANSAAAAAASASAAAASAATINNALPLAGGTMTGPLILNADPAVNLGAATKQYVDARVGGTAFLPISGGAITGSLSIAGTLGVTGPSYLGAVVRAYLSATVPVIFGFHDSFGGAGFHIDAVGNINFSTYDGAGGGIFNRASISPAGSVYASQQLVAPYIHSSGSVAWNGAVGLLAGDSANTYIQFETNGWKLLFQRSTGNLIYINSANAWLSWIDGSGGFHTQGLSVVGDANSNRVFTNFFSDAGEAHIYGTFVAHSLSTFVGRADANDFHSAGITATNVQVDNNLNVSNVFACNGNATIAGLLTITAISNNSNINTMTITCVGNISCGDIVANSDIRSHANIIAEGRGYQPGGGAWIALSDERIKTVNGPYASSLAQLVQLEPVKYVYKDNHYMFDANYHPDTAVEHIGLVAQDAEVAMPELVKQVTGHIDGVQVSDFRELDGSALIYAVINALKEVSTRLDALEAARR